MHLLLIYPTVSKRQKAETRNIKDWTDESVLCLQECFDCEDWEMFKQSWCDTLDELVTSSYLSVGT